MTREEFLDDIYCVHGAYSFLMAEADDIDDWFKNDRDFDDWAYSMMSDCNWKDARDFLNGLPDEYSEGFYIRSDSCDDGSWEFFRISDYTPEWLMEYCLECAYIVNYISDGDEEDDDHVESESNSGVDTLADPPKPEDTISFEDFDSLFEEVAS